MLGYIIFSGYEIYYFYTMTQRQKVMYVENELKQQVKFV